jgi:hypothetical protein
VKFIDANGNYNLAASPKFPSTTTSAHHDSWPSHAVSLGVLGIWSCSSGLVIFVLPFELIDGSTWYYQYTNPMSIADAETQVDTWNSLTYLPSGEWYFGLVYNFNVRGGKLNKFTYDQLQAWLMAH